MVVAWRPLRRAAASLVLAGSFAIVATAHPPTASAPALLPAADKVSQTLAARAYDKTVASAVQTMVDQVLGVGRAVVVVNATLDFAATSSTVNSYTDNPKGVPPSAEVGSTTYRGPAQAGGGGYRSTSSTIDNALGVTTRVAQRAPGAVTKLAVAVLVDRAVSGANVTAIRSLVAAAGR